MRDTTRVQRFQGEVVDIPQVSDTSCVQYFKTTLQKNEQGFLDYFLHYENYSMANLIQYVYKYQRKQEERMLRNQWWGLNKVDKPRPNTREVQP